jgi:hypothetical protein
MPVRQREEVQKVPWSVGELMDPRPHGSPDPLDLIPAGFCRPFSYAAPPGLATDVSGR